MIALLSWKWPTHKVNENISFYFFIPSHTTLEKLPIPLPGLVKLYNIFYHFFIYSATLENDLSLQTKGVLILVPGIFGVLSNITLMLIILSIASAQRYCPRNAKSYEQTPLYLKERKPCQYLVSNIRTTKKPFISFTWLYYRLSKRSLTKLRMKIVHRILPLNTVFRLQMTPL